MLVATVCAAQSVPPVQSDAAELTDEQKIDQCLVAVANAKSDPRACVGVVADPCLEGLSGGAHEGAVECMQREAVIWAARLDVSVKELGALLGGDGPKVLAEIHESWKTYRQKRCSFGRVLYPQSDFAAVWQSTCVLEETGRRAAEVGAILKEARNRGG